MAVKVTNTGVTNSQPPEETTDRSVSSRGSFNRRNSRFGLKIFVACLAVIFSVIVIVGISLNNSQNDNESNNSNNSVILDYKPEGYGDNPAASVIVAVFSEKINDKLNGEDGYDYDKAIKDYKRAYNESTGSIKLDVASAYAFFIYKRTSNVEQAAELLLDLEEIIDSHEEMFELYSIFMNLYQMSGDDVKYEQYRLLAEGLPVALRINNMNALIKEVG